MSTRRIDVLVSFAYMSKDMLLELRAAAPYINLFVDSGAFTAYTQGEQIALADYMAFLRGGEVQVERYFTLDVIGDPAGTLRNDDAMRAAGLEPVPVFTRGAPWEHFTEYSRRSPIVACGGLAQPGVSPLGYIKALTQRTPLSHVHLLGMSRPGVLAEVRPYSADTSSWMSARRYGGVNLYVGRGRFVRVTRRTVQAQSALIRGVINRMGLDASLLLDPAHWRGAHNSHGIVETLSWLRFQRELAEQRGVRLFLAVAASSFLKSLVTVVRQHGGQTA